MECNESSGAIERTLAATARAITSERFALNTSYGGLAASLGDGPPVLMRVHELRYDASLQARVHRILENVRNRELDASAALAELEQAKVSAVRHSRWFTVPAIGLAASALALLLGGDRVAVVAVGLSTALGLVARQTLARRHFSLLALPFVATLIGAAIGALAIRLSWTQTPGLVVIVPSLMVVPGPHFINALFDLIDNHIPMSIARLWLALGILLASACGVVVGMNVMFWNPLSAAPTDKAAHLNLILDMVLAGVVTCGFAMFYNVALSHLGLAIVGGMLGHGLRYGSIELGANLPTATFFGALVVGAIAALVARSYRVPVAVVAFAGAVTMMPGIQMYRALRGFLQLANGAADLQATANMMGDTAQAILVTGALALGVIVGVRAIEFLFAVGRVRAA